MFAKHFSFLSADLIFTCLSRPLLEDVFPHLPVLRGNSSTELLENHCLNLSLGPCQWLWHFISVYHLCPPHSIFLFYWGEMIRDGKTDSLIAQVPGQGPAESKYSLRIGRYRCCCYCCCCWWGWQWWAWRWDACSEQNVSVKLMPLSISPFFQKFINKGSP